MSELREAIEKAIQDLSRTLGRAEIEMVRRDLRAALAAPSVEPASVTGKPDRREPHPGETETPLFNVIWSVVKNWEIQTPSGSWYSATGNEVCQIIDAIRGVTGKPSKAGQPCPDKHHNIGGKCWTCGIDPDAATSLADALRSVNDLQHRMAIELQNIPQEPRIEYWTRKMEDVICKALESRHEGEAKAK